MNAMNQVGGARPGAGRPKGSRNRRSLALGDQLRDRGQCPAAALARIAEQAEAAGNLTLAIDAWKALLPYVHAKPKPVEIDPEAVVELARAIADVRQETTCAITSDYADMLEEAKRRHDERFADVEAERSS
jgi:hypothetical protein